MEEKDLIYLHPDNYQEWSQIAIKFLSQHNALPYARGLEYDLETSTRIGVVLFLHTDYDILDEMTDLKMFDHYDNWMYLWETFGDPAIPPFPQELIPPVAADTSSDEITPPAPVAPTDPVPAIDALDSVQHDTSCLPTLPSCDDFLADITQLFVESHIEDVGDIIDDICLLFEADTPSFAAVKDSRTSALQGTHGLPGVDFLPDTSVLFLESHIVNMGDFYDDFSFSLLRILLQLLRGPTLTLKSMLYMINLSRLV